MNTTAASGKERHPSPLTEEMFASIGKSLKGDKVLQMVREEAFERMCALEFPSTSHELWRHTKPSQFAFSRLEESVPAKISVDGLTSADSMVSSSLPEDLAQEIFHEKASDLELNAVAFLQMASIGSATYVRIPRNTIIEHPLFLRTETAAGAMSIPLVVFLIEEGASVTIVEDLHGGGGQFLFPRIEILIRDNASVTFLSNNRLPIDATYLGRHRIHLERDARAHALHFLSGGHVTRLDLDCRFYGAGSDAKLSSVYLADGNRHVDLHTVQDHIAPHCGSDLMSKGILRDKGRSVYYGFVRVAAHAQRTDAYQTNRNLVFSREARADSIPNLEIKANDVKCSHGATVGQVSEEELFYLMTRGLRRHEAEQLLVEGFTDEVILRIQNEDVLGLVREAFMERLCCRK